MGLKDRPMQDRYMIRAMEFKPAQTLPLSADAIASALGSLGPANFNRYLSLVVAIHNSNAVTPPKVDRRKPPPGRTRWLTKEEWKRLSKALEAESPLLWQAAEFTLQTGLRENNVLELEWEQIDLRRRVAWLHGDQTKQKKSLGVPLNDAATAVLEARRGIHKRWVFGNPDMPLTRASNRAWYAARKRAKLPGFRWHDLRHTWASWHAMNGTRLEDLQQLGGWATAQMVQRYRHLAPEHLAQAAANLKPVSLRYNKRRSRT